MFREEPKALTLDLDDTLWPIAPTIARAELALKNWLQQHAPQTAALASLPGHAMAARQAVLGDAPNKAHDLAFLRRESIRYLLAQAGDPIDLAEPAFEVFFAERQRVMLFDGVAEAMDWLAARFSIVAVSNGNAQLSRVGIAHWFVGAVSAADVGVPKPAEPIFKAALQLLGLPASQVLHVGDDWAADVLGADAAGFQTAWIAHDHPAWPEGACAQLQQRVIKVASVPTLRQRLAAGPWR